VCRRPLATTTATTAHRPHWSVLLDGWEDGLAEAPDKNQAQELALRSSPLADARAGARRYC
jgi:hypothetical protein